MDISLASASTPPGEDVWMCVGGDLDCVDDPPLRSTMVMWVVGAPFTHSSPDEMRSEIPYL